MEDVLPFETKARETNYPKRQSLRLTPNLDNSPEIVALRREIVAETLMEFAAECVPVRPEDKMTAQEVLEALLEKLDIRVRSY